jgi:two-component system, chemotaxis family, CheB/CheR fusion protein
LDVLDVAQGTITLRKQPIDLLTVLKQVIDVCMPDIEARELYFEMDPGPMSSYWVNADRDRLQQAFSNVLRNAVKFTPRDGWIRIRCDSEDGQVVVRINDTGIGIPPEDLPRVFNAFEQAQRSNPHRYGGLGLGLTVSRTLLEMHGGAIEALSEGRDKGTTIVFRLPLIAQNQIPVAAGTLADRAKQAPLPRRVDRRLHILLVEDHGLTAQMLAMALTAQGNQVDVAADVATALSLADHEKFDLLVSDLGLPDGTGYDLMRQLRQHGHGFPAIAISGYGQEQDVRHSHEAGFAAHLTKPVTREAIFDTIAAVTA